MVKNFWLAGCFAFVAACATVRATGPAPVAATAPKTAPSGCGALSGTVVDEKAMYAAEAAYNVPAQAYVAANNAGKLNVATKATLKPLLLKAYGALKVARTAYNAGDACGFVNQFAAVKLLSSQVLAKLPK